MKSTSPTLKTLLLTMAFGGTLLAQPGATVFSAAGNDADAIKAEVESFRTALGPLNAPGPTGDPNGRREINWDAVPSQFAAPNNLPENFFNRNSIRGVVFTGGGSSWTGFQVSSNDSEGPVRFDNLYQGYSSLFKVFSEQRLFASVGSNVYDTDFFIPGTDTRGTVSGFGAVFTNVAIPFTTLIEAFTADGLSLGRYYAKVSPKGLSFLGILYQTKLIARIRITLGTAAPGVAEDLGNGINIVAADDFLYSEPANRCVVR